MFLFLFKAWCVMSGAWKASRKVAYTGKRARGLPSHTANAWGNNGKPLSRGSMSLLKQGGTTTIMTT